MSIRNPQLTNVNVHAAACGVTNSVCEVVYPYHAYVSAEEAATFSIPGETVWQSVAYPASALTVPAPMGVRSRLIESRKGTTTYTVQLTSESARTFDVVSPVKISGISGDNIKATKLEERRWRVTMSNGMAPPTTHVQLDELTAVSNGVIKCRLLVPDSATAKLKLLLSRHARIAAAMMNGKPCSCASNKGTGWQLTTVRCPSGTNDLVIQFDLGQAGAERAKVTPFVECDRLLRDRKVVITHDNVTPRERYSRPYPLLQNIERRSMKHVPIRNIEL